MFASSGNCWRFGHTFGTPKLMGRLRRDLSSRCAVVLLSCSVAVLLCVCVAVMLFSCCPVIMLCWWADGLMGCCRCCGCSLSNNTTCWFRPPSCGLSSACWNHSPFSAYPSQCTDWFGNGFDYGNYGVQDTTKRRSDGGWQRHMLAWRGCSGSLEWASGWLR